MVGQSIYYGFTSPPPKRWESTFNMVHILIPYIWQWKQTVLKYLPVKYMYVANGYVDKILFPRHSNLPCGNLL